MCPSLYSNIRQSPEILVEHEPLSQYSIMLLIEAYKLVLTLQSTVHYATEELLQT